MNKARLTFFGGAGNVTGSNFLFEAGDKKILVDCGFFQGCDVCDEKNRAPFPYDPKSIDILFVTHAHLDHAGRIPKLVREGFRGKIISTPPIKDIAELILLDSLGILRKESKKNRQALIYDKHDVEKTMGLWESVPYHEEILIKEGLTALLRDAGHMLGSAMIDITYYGKRIVFSGDLGNSPTPLLRDSEVISGVKYLIMESVYGDRRHETKTERKDILEDIIEGTTKKGGTLLIPAFSIERTQEILFEIEAMMENNKIPLIPVFLDSPLAIHVTEIYKKYEDYYNTKVQYAITAGEDIFAFPQLHFTLKTEESKKIHQFGNPKIIIAGSGMSNGGRIVYHEKRYLPDPATTLLIVGYQAPGSVGREIQDGAKHVTILGERVEVNARVETISGYSSHKDTDGLFHFAANTADGLEKAFIVMGEPKSSAFLTQRLRDYIGINALVPREGESFELEF